MGGREGDPLSILLSLAVCPPLARADFSRGPTETLTDSLHDVDPRRWLHCVQERPLPLPTTSPQLTKYMYYSQPAATAAAAAMSPMASAATAAPPPAGRIRKSPKQK